MSHRKTTMTVNKQSSPQPAGGPHKKPEHAQTLRLERSRLAREYLQWVVDNPCLAVAGGSGARAAEL